MEETKFSKLKLSEFEFTDDDLKVDARPAVALPDDEPVALDLSHLPKDVLRSGTVESLISQNEDLMARLKVNLRRMSALEDELDQTQRENAAVSSQFRALKDQILIYKEKDSRRFGEGNQLRDKIEELQKQLSLTERSYAELTETFGAKDKKQRQEIDQLQYSLTRFLRYRARIHAFVKPSLRESLRSRKAFTEELQSLNAELERKNQMIEGLREQITKISQNAKIQTESFENLKLQLIEAHEREKSRLVEENSALKNFEIEAVRGRQKIQALSEKETELANDLIRTQRAKESLSEKFSSQIKELQSVINEKAREFGEIQFHFNETQSENERLQSSTTELTETLRIKSEQLEQARLMWEKKAEELAQVQKSNQALEKINIELSHEAKTARETHKELLERATGLEAALTGSANEAFDQEARLEQIRAIKELLVDKA